MLGIRYPIIQGGMANIATGAFAAACSEAGALGLIGTGGIREAEGLRKEIHTLRERTSKPFGVNLRIYMEALKEAGIKVFPVVAAPILAERMEKLGADGIIVEGTESGGHVGEMTTMTLVPQTVDSVDIPVIAAGGIADRRQLKAVFTLGAIGAQIGTILLSAEECPIHENYKEAILKAKGSDTVVTGRIAGVPVRILKNAMSREYLRLEKEGAEKMELEKFTLGSLRKAVFEGDTKMGSLMAGQTCGQVQRIRPVKEILAELCEE